MKSQQFLGRQEKERWSVPQSVGWLAELVALKQAVQLGQAWDPLFLASVLLGAL